jgi:hypothetical protein
MSATSRSRSGVRAGRTPSRRKAGRRSAKRVDGRQSRPCRPQPRCWSGLTRSPVLSGVSASLGRRRREVLRRVLRGPTPVGGPCRGGRVCDDGPSDGVRQLYGDVPGRFDRPANRRSGRRPLDRVRRPADGRDPGPGRGPTRGRARSRGAGGTTDRPDAGTIHGMSRYKISVAGPGRRRPYSRRVYPVESTAREGTSPCGAPRNGRAQMGSRVLVGTGLSIRLDTPAGCYSSPPPARGRPYH